MKVTIQEKEYDFSVTSVWGPLYTYEEIFGDKIPFVPTKRFCIHLMLYCILLRSNKDIDLLVEDFLSALDNMELEKSLSTYYFKRLEFLSQGIKEESDDKKKD